MKFSMWGMGLWFPVILTGIFPISMVINFLNICCWLVKVLVKTCYLTFMATLDTGDHSCLEMKGWKAYLLISALHVFPNQKQINVETKTLKNSQNYPSFSILRPLKIIQTKTRSSEMGFVAEPFCLAWTIASFVPLFGQFLCLWWNVKCHMFFS